MPMLPNGPMGAGNPQNIEAMAAAGDPRAIAMLQQMQAAQGGGGGMPPMQGSGGMPPMQGAGPMPPAGGMPPPGQGQLSPQGGGPPISPDVQARRAQQLIMLLRAQGRQ
jgi:hypothetical protein